MVLIIGEKLGMTQIYDESGIFIPVTVIKVEPNQITAVKTNEKHGYNAVQIGYSNKKESRLNKAEQGLFKKQKVQPVAVLREFLTDKSSDYKVGDSIAASVLQAGDKIHVQAVSKGKGFQGVMKRFNFSGGADSHGNSLSHRVPGSIGMCTDPGRVLKNTKLPGQMGNAQVTTKNLVVVAVEADQNLVLIKGAVPGSKGSKIAILPQAAEVEARIFASQPEQTEVADVKKEAEPQAEASA